MVKTIFVLLSVMLLASTPSSSSPISADQGGGQAPRQSPSPINPCKSTIYPKLCRAILAAYGRSPSNHDAGGGYGNFTVKRCLKQARRVSKLIDHFLNSHKQSSMLSSMQRNALDDCAQLADMTVEYLESISAKLKSASASDDLVGEIQALLSAVVTNQETCYDGVRDAFANGKNNLVVGSANALFSPLSSASELYSVSLGLVVHVLGRTAKKSGKGRVLADWVAHVPASMFTQVRRAVDKSRKGGRLLAEMMASGSVHVNGSVTVSLYGGGNFSSIGDAIESAPNDLKPENGYFVIHVKQGYYEEYVVVPKHKKNIMLLGDGINRTVIAGNRSVLDGWTTFRSATFAVSGERFVAVGITFANVAGPAKHQAVAVRNNADLSTFYRCSFIGYQDTLYVHSLRQFYRECKVYGTVDFIFGNAAAVFQNCNLYARKPMPDQKNAFIAQSRSDPNQNTGISIQNCTIHAAPDLAMDMNSTRTYLGRPWKQYSRTVYMQSYIGDLIDPAGWLAWNATISLDKIYYGEYGNYGPGSNTTMRVKWPGYCLMNATQAMNFTVYNLTMGHTWLPYTSIPFSAGL